MLLHTPLMCPPVLQEQGAVDVNSLIKIERRNDLSVSNTKHRHTPLRTNLMGGKCVCNHYSLCLVNTPEVFQRPRRHHRDPCSSSGVGRREKRPTQIFFCPGGRMSESL